MRRVLSLLLVFAATVSATWAADRAITSAGVVHTVRSESFSSQSGDEGALLLHRQQYPDGRVAQNGIPATTDLLVDSEPTLTLIDDQLLLLWSRDEGDGLDLYTSRWDGESWSDPSLLISRTADTLSPTVAVTGRHTQVIWREEDNDDGSLWFRLTIGSNDLAIRFGPDELPEPEDDLASLVPTDGEADSSAAPDKDDAYMAGEFREPGDDAGSVVVWGIRDEPVPIDFARGFLLPDDVQDVEDLQADWLGEELTLSYTHGKNFYYTRYVDGRWGDQRVIVLEGGLTAESARRLIETSAEESATAPADEPLEN